MNEITVESVMAQVIEQIKSTAKPLSDEIIKPKYVTYPMDRKLPNGDIKDGNTGVIREPTWIDKSDIPGKW